MLPVSHWYLQSFLIEAVEQDKGLGLLYLNSVRKVDEGLRCDIRLQLWQIRSFASSLRMLFSFTMGTHLRNDYSIRKCSTFKCYKDLPAQEPIDLKVVEVLVADHFLQTR